jgi:hypothetical protein
MEYGIWNLELNVYIHIPYSKFHIPCTYDRR